MVAFAFITPVIPRLRFVAGCSHT